MRCIFCKKKSDHSISVEHIIPESLGNIEHILPPGWVCDACNNYLAREVEKPFLDSLYGRYSRFIMNVPSKKGRIPATRAFHVQSGTIVDLFYSDDDGLSVGAAAGENESKWIQSLLTNIHGRLYLPAPDFPDLNMETSRFIGKVAMEVLAHRTLGIPIANDEIVNKDELNELRNYVRLGIPKIVWPVNIRRLYSQDKIFADEKDNYQTLHEFTMLGTLGNEYYCVVAIFGVEYTINLGGPELDGYHKWLEKNNNRSPLYPDLDLKYPYRQ